MISKLKKKKKISIMLQNTSIMAAYATMLLSSIMLKNYASRIRQGLLKTQGRSLFGSSSARTIGLDHSSCTALSQ